VVVVKHRMAFGTREALEHVLAVWGWKLNTSFIERLNSADGMQHPLAVFHVYYNFVLTHASLRHALAVPVPTNGSGSVKVWRPCTPAMAGLTDHVWSLREVLLFRVPPWPQAQTG
jgi:hypothetical protein